LVSSSSVARRADRHLADLRRPADHHDDSAPVPAARAYAVRRPAVHPGADRLAHPVGHLGSAGLDCSGSCLSPVVPPRNKRLNRAAVPESSLGAICLRTTKIIANAVWNFGHGIPECNFLEVRESAGAKTGRPERRKAESDTRLGHQRAKNLSESQRIKALCGIVLIRYQMIVKIGRNGNRPTPRYKG
jgi:hypothetical protein